LLDSFIEFLEGIIKEDPDASNYLNDQLLNYYNSKKAYQGMLDGLRNPMLMQKKKDFENKLKEKVQSNDELNENTEQSGPEIENAISEMKSYRQNSQHFLTIIMTHLNIFVARLIGLWKSKLAEADSTYALYRR
jgi:hypothetical protein